MTLVGLVFDVCGIDCDTTGSFFRSLVDVVVRGVAGLAAHARTLVIAAVREVFAVVNMADRADIDVGLVSFKFCLCHGDDPPFSSTVFEVPFVNYFFRLFGRLFHFTQINCS
jgi:hypothetical protein